MAKCDQGYLCEVCGQEVERLVDSALYLQFVIGWIDPETLHSRQECHLLCLPTLAQFINDERFDTVEVAPEFERRQMDSAFVAERTGLVTRGYLRLCQLQQSSDRGLVTDYPLSEALERWQ